MVDYEKLSGDRVGESNATMKQLKLSARAYHHILKLALTIADLVALYVVDGMFSF